MNGLLVTADEDEFEKLVLDAAQSLITKEQIAEFFRKNTSANPDTISLVDNGD